MTKGIFVWEHFEDGKVTPSRSRSVTPDRNALINLAEAEKIHGQGTRESGNEIQEQR